MSGASVTWSSSNTAVATVLANGLVTAISGGSATVLAQSGSVSAVASVTVTQFYLAANGVTVICSGADVGDTGEVGGVTYTKRSHIGQIDELVAAGDYAPLATTCTSDITDMMGMFYYAEEFNQDLSGWCVSLITSKPTDFDTGATSWIGGTPRNRPVWGTCPT